ncbi:MAG: ubiquinone/menaquinone biosynthesis protein [Planctomycetaceae bacterium]|nr:ubiquinone/menaquinone biosynthesis protein [Planctomycetaceae bacterium]
MTFELPAVDDKSIYDAYATRFVFPALMVSVEIGLYEHLGRGPCSVPDLAQDLGLDVRATEAVVAVVAALGFLEGDAAGRFRMTPQAEVYLSADSPFFRADLPHFESAVADALRLVMRVSGAPVEPLAVQIAELPSERVRTFMEVMHAMTLPAAAGLAEQPVFQRIHNLLDVAGGTGSLSMALVSRHPALKCTVLDLAPVCAIATEQIDRRGLGDRVHVVSANMFEDPWPVGYDALLFGNIFHDWDLESCRVLARRAFETLPPGGTICLHEMLLSEAKDGPLTVACFSIAMLLHEKGKQFTARELQQLLAEAGFVEFQVTPSYGYYSLVSARKSPLA